MGMTGWRLSGSLMCRFVSFIKAKKILSMLKLYLVRQWIEDGEVRSFALFAMKVCFTLHSAKALP